MTRRVSRGAARGRSGGVLPARSTAAWPTLCVARLPRSATLLLHLAHCPHTLQAEDEEQQQLSRSDSLDWGSDDCSHTDSHNEPRRLEEGGPRHEGARGGEGHGKGGGGHGAELPREVELRETPPRWVEVGSRNGSTLDAPSATASGSVPHEDAAGGSVLSHTQRLLGGSQAGVGGGEMAVALEEAVLQQSKVSAEGGGGSVVGGGSVADSGIWAGALGAGGSAERFAL